MEFLPRLFVIAPSYRQVQIFLSDMDWRHRQVQVAIKPADLYGYRLDINWEVWWLDRLWPCRTHEDVEYMEKMKRLAKSRGADLHRWWT